jgi:hypothetical protein
MKIRMGRTVRRIINTMMGRPGEEGGTRQPNLAGLKSKLSTGQQQALYQLSEHPGYAVLLDVMEMACIEQDTRLINTDAAKPEDVLNEHRMSKTFWQIFVAVQKKVAYEREEYLGTLEKEAAGDVETDEELDMGILRG